MRNAAPFRSDHPSPISCGLNLLDLQETAKYTSRHKKEVLININLIRKQRRDAAPSVAVEKVYALTAAIRVAGLFMAPGGLSPARASIIFSAA